MLKYLRIAFAVAFGIACVVVFLHFGRAAICDGWYDLTVEIAPEAAEGVSRVSYLGVGNSKLANDVIASIDAQLRFMEQLSSAQPFTISVGHSHRASILGTWGDVQEYSDIVVVLHRDDGTVAVHRVAVPHRDKSRHVIVNAASRAN